MPLRSLILAWLSILFLGSNSPVLAQTPTVIDFEQFTGPSVFTGVQPPLTVGVATFSGGQLLTNTSLLPADQTTVYGTAFFCSGCLPTITIDFAQPVSAFSVFLLNGQTFTVKYTVQDDRGATRTISLVANFHSSAGTVTLPSNGIRRVTITSNAGEWDFFVDNLSFVSSCSSNCVTPVTIRTNPTCDPSINANCTPNIVLADGSDSTDLTTTVQPARSVAVHLSTSFGAVADVQTDSRGMGISTYTSGTLTLGVTTTTVATISAAIGSQQFADLARVFDYRGFEFHQSQVSDVAFVDSTTLDTAGIQMFFDDNNSFLAEFILVGRIGGFMDTNHNGTLDPGELTYSATGSPVPLHARGVSAATIFARSAMGQGIIQKCFWQLLKKRIA